MKLVRLQPSCQRPTAAMVAVPNLETRKLHSRYRCWMWHFVKSEPGNRWLVGNCARSALDALLIPSATAQFSTGWTADRLCVNPDPITRNNVSLRAAITRQIVFSFQCTVIRRQLFCQQLSIERRHIFCVNLSNSFACNGAMLPVTWLSVSRSTRGAKWWKKCPPWMAKR